jgi:uncharacterized protein YcfJ
MHTKMKLLLGTASLVLATQAAAQVTFYSGEGFRGQMFHVAGPVGNFDRTGFNDRASSVIVEHGRWQVCEDAHFYGRCIILTPGSYPSLVPMGMDNRISSVRPVMREVRYENEVAPPPPAPVYEYRVRPSERLFQANVTSVHAVVGPPEQRCWVERQQVVESRPDAANVPGAIIGGIIGGVLGHQVGAGHGRDVATAGGAVAGAAIGANVNRGGTAVYGQDVQRCAAVPGSARADYWDVEYEFRGVIHHVQLGAPPGPTITVNERGEPRG